jgi:hypothetical protein
MVDVQLPGKRMAAVTTKDLDPAVTIWDDPPAEARRLMALGTAGEAKTAVDAQRWLYGRTSKRKHKLYLDRVSRHLEEILSAERAVANAVARELYDRNRKREEKRQKRRDLALKLLESCVEGTDEISNSVRYDNEVLSAIIAVLADANTDLLPLMQRLMVEQGLDTVLELAVQAGDAELALAQKTWSVSERNRLGRQVQALADFAKQLENMI